ncbi:MAG: glyoxalase/bleomycin resistance/extradiol dioxygenase family protein [Bacteroidetes bacterium]|nr:glyoxalase/bleomycin resistance/extradiol dioxygenase family protein [Bacteroidota bacterium]
MTSIKSIFVNLPVNDLERSRSFWSNLGFGFNKQFSDEKALCLVLSEDRIYAMLITHPFFKTFTNRPIADGTSTQVLLAIEVESKDRVDEIVQLALENGGTRYREGEDHGWMYYDSFADPDGHQWEIMWSDMSQLPTP